MISAYTFNNKGWLFVKNVCAVYEQYLTLKKIFIQEMFQSEEKISVTVYIYISKTEAIKDTYTES